MKRRHWGVMKAEPLPSEMVLWKATAACGQVGRLYYEWNPNLVTCRKCKRAYRVFHRKTLAALRRVRRG